MLEIVNAHAHEIISSQRGNAGAEFNYDDNNFQLSLEALLKLHISKIYSIATNIIVRFSNTA